MICLYLPLKKPEIMFWIPKVTKSYWNSPLPSFGNVFEDMDLGFSSFFSLLNQFSVKTFIHLQIYIWYLSSTCTCNLLLSCLFYITSIYQKPFQNIQDCYNLSNSASYVHILGEKDRLVSAFKAHVSSWEVKWHYTKEYTQMRRPLKRYKERKTSHQHSWSSW